MPADDRDLVIEALADNEAALLARVAEIQVVTRASIRTTLALTADNVRLRRELGRVEAEYRDLREQILMQMEAV